MMDRYAVIYTILTILTLKCGCDESICAKTNLNHCLCEQFTNDNNGFISSKVDCSFKDFEAVDFDLPTNTEELDISVNNIHELSIINISKPLALRKLYIGKNKIQEIPSKIFITLKNLSELDLSENQINSIKNDAFSGLASLNILNLALNNLSSLKINTFKHLPQLEILILNGNNLGNFIEYTPNVFDYLQISSSIEEISLRSVNLRNFREDVFNAVQNLKRLDVSENQIEILPDLPKSLKVLDISSCNFQNLSQHFNLPALTHLYMNDLQNIHEIKSHVFKHLQNLKVLEAKNCKGLTILSPFVFGELSPDFYMNELNFLGSGLSNFNESFNDLFSRSDNIDLRGTPLNCNCDIKWILNLNLTTLQKEFTRCKTPNHLMNLQLFSLTEKRLCEDEPWNTRIVTTVALVCVCLTLAGLALWLVLLWQPLQVITPQHVTSYIPVVIQPNNAEIY